MNPRTCIIGCQLFFFPAGTAFTVPSAGTASATAKPGATDPLWIKMEHCVDFAFKGGASGEAKPIFRPSPGRLRRVDIRRVKPVGDFTFTTGVLQPLAIQAILNTAALTSASTQFNPQEGIVPLKGWLKMQAYDDEDVAIWTADKFGELSVPGDTKLDPENPTNVAWDFMGLHSLLDTGTLHV